MLVPGGIPNSHPTPQNKLSVDFYNINFTPLTILESITAFAMSLPKNLNLEQTSSTMLNLVLGPRGAGNNPTGLCTYSISPESPSIPQSNNSTSKHSATILKLCQYQQNLRRWLLLSHHITSQIC